MKTSALAAILLFVAAAGLAAAAAPKTHTLLKGETLYSVSRKYDVPYEALASANGIVDPTKVRIGTVLVIPSVHVVAKGETLSSIARAYGTTVDKLLASNRLASGYVLRAGDALVVPGAEPAPATTPGSAPASASSTSTTSTTTTTTITTAPATTVPTTPVPAPASPPQPQAQLPVTTTIPPAPAAPTPGTQVSAPAAPTPPAPAPLRTQGKSVDMKLEWPASGKAYYLDGKLEGVMIRVKPGERSKAVAAGTVVSAGPSRGFGQVAFVQSKAGYVYVYGGNESLYVKTGDQIESGREIGQVGLDTRDGSPVAYFFVFRNGQSLDPALAPRD